MWQYNQQTGQWEWVEKPTQFKTQKEAKQFQQNEADAIYQAISTGMGLGPSPVQELAKESAKRNVYEEQISFITENTGY